MNTAGRDSTSASSILSDTWYVCSAIDPVLRLRSFTWLTGLRCCLRNTHAESTSYGSPSMIISRFGRTSLYASIAICESSLAKKCCLSNQSIIFIRANFSLLNAPNPCFSKNEVAPVMVSTSYTLRVFASSRHWATSCVAILLP